MLLRALGFLPWVLVPPADVSGSTWRPTSGRIRPGALRLARGPPGPSVNLRGVGAGPEDVVTKGATHNRVRGSAVGADDGRRAVPRGAAHRERASGLRGDRGCELARGARRSSALETAAGAARAEGGGEERWRTRGRTDRGAWPRRVGASASTNCLGVACMNVACQCPTTSFTATVVAAW